jgi:hypothetical protein
MKVLEFKRYSVVEDIIDCLTDQDDDIIEAIVIGKKKSGSRFSYMTTTENIPELIGYLEAVKADLAMELIYQAERDGDE